MLYRFISEHNKHTHELALDDVNFKPLFGTTTIINDVYPPPLAWYGSEKALEPLGFISDKKLRTKFYKEAEDEAIKINVTLKAQGDEERPIKGLINELLGLKKRSIAEEGLDRLDELLSTELRLDQYLGFLEMCYKNHDEYKKTRGKAGTDMHAKIEEYIKDCMSKNAGKPLSEGYDDIKPFILWGVQNVETFLWSEANCYSEKLWVGGITDFGFIDKAGRKILGDAKPAVYPKQFIQTAAYNIQMRENGLFDENGKQIMKPMSVDGFCIFDYTKGEGSYLGAEWVPKLEADFVHTVEMYKRKELTGFPVL